MTFFYLYEKRFSKYFQSFILLSNPEYPLGAPEIHEKKLGAKVTTKGLWIKDHLSPDASIKVCPFRDE